MPAPSIDSVSNLSPEFQKAFHKAAQAERKTIDILNQKKENVESKAKLLDDVIGKVDSVKKMLPEVSNGNRLRELAVVSANDRVITGIAEKGKARVGSYEFEVVQLARRASASSNAFEDRDQTRVGTGYFSVTLPDGESRELFVDEENSTLDGLAKIINDSKLGIRANVINDKGDPDTPFRLLLTSDAIGDGAVFEYPEFYFIDGEEEFYMESEQPGSNSLIRYQGIDMEHATNEVKDLIPGVTVVLRGTSDGRSVNLNIEQDTEKTAGKVKQVFDGLNQVFTFIQGQNRMDQNTNTQKTLGGDYGIRMAETRLKQALSKENLYEEGASVRALGDIGIQFNRNGTMNIDENKLNLALANHFDQVADLLVGDGLQSGVAHRLERALNSISGTQSAILTQQRKNMASQIERINKDSARREEIAGRRIEELKLKLARAQESLTALQAQSGQVAAQISQFGK